jgi:hypothetical protein
MHISKIISSAILAISITVAPTYAKSGSVSSSSSSHSSSSSFSKPSSSYSSSSSSGFSKPSSSASPAPVASAPSTSGFSKPSASPAPVVTAQPTVQSRPTGALAAANNKAVSANTLNAYQAERASARTPPQPIPAAQVRGNPVFTSARSSYGGNPDVYYSRRTVVYSSYRSTHPDVFIISGGMHPFYGIYDTGFLTGMWMGYLGESMAHNAMWMYGQQNQPWYPAYRADLEQQAQNNADLRAKMQQMDAEIAQLKAQGVQPPQVTNLPQGVDPSMAIAPEAVMADAPDQQHFPWLYAIGGVVVGAVGLAVLLLIIF